MTSEKKPKAETMQSQVLNKLRDGLMEGALLPGHVISIRKFAAMFGTSPMPVRDALSQLVAANALEEMPNRSVCVPVLTRSRIAELFAVREMLETRITRQACERITQEVIDELVAMNTTVARENMQQRETKFEVLRRNRQFHFTLYGAAQSEVLLPLIESLWLQCGPMLFLTLETANAVMARSQHERMCEGLLKRDADLVTDALACEIRETGRTLLEHYDALISSGPMTFINPASDMRLSLGNP